MEIKLLVGIDYDGECINVYPYKDKESVYSYLQTLETMNGYLRDNGYTIDDFDYKNFTEDEYWRFLESLEEPGIFEIKTIHI